MTFFITQDTANAWRWELQRDDGTVEGRSEVAYGTEEACAKAIMLLRCLCRLPGRIQRR